MTESELKNLREALQQEYNRLHKESKKYDKILGTKTEDILINGKNRQAKAKLKKEKYEEAKAAVKKFQDAIAEGSTATIEEQKEAYEALGKLKDKY